MTSETTPPAEVAKERERIAQAIEADYAAWAALGDPTTPRERDAAWFVERACQNAARIAREAGQS